MKKYTVTFYDTENDCVVTRREVESTDWMSAQVKVVEDLVKEGLGWITSYPVLEEITV